MTCTIGNWVGNGAMLFKYLLEMKDLERYQLTIEEILEIKGGITYCGFMDVLDHLGKGSRNQIDQSVVLFQKFNQGQMQFEDYDYNGEPPAC